MTKQEIIDYVNTNHQGFGAYGFANQYAKGVMIENESSHKSCFINEQYYGIYKTVDIDRIIRRYPFHFNYR